MTRLKHPFGFLDGERVVPAEVEDGETAECPRDGCDERLHVRGPYVGGTVRHFWHPGSSGGGSGGAHGGGGGESAIHENYKSHAASVLLNFFGEFIEESTTKEIFEQNFAIPGTDRRRQADARVTFNSPHSTFGKGIIIEVQHENRDKNTDAVTQDYLDTEYSVWWTDSETHYEPSGYLFDRDQLEDETITVWPNAVPEESEWEEIPRDAYALRTAPNKYKLAPNAKTSRVWDYSNRGAVEVSFPAAFPKPSVERTIQLPQEFYGDIARELFRETNWGNLFSGYEWDSRTSLPGPDNGTKRNSHVDAKLCDEWAGPPETQQFRDTPWDELFPGYGRTLEMARSEWGLSDSSEGSVPATFHGEEALSFYQEERLEGIVESLDAREVPFPGQLWHVTKRCLKTACLPGEHDWIELTGWPDARWRECRRCGLNDVTWGAVYGELEGQAAAESEQSDSEEVAP